MGLKERAEASPVFFLLVALAAGFGAGFAAYDTILRVSHRISVPAESYVSPQDLDRGYVKRSFHDEMIVRLRDQLAVATANLQQSQARPVPIQAPSTVPGPLLVAPAAAQVQLTAERYLLAVEGNNIPLARRHLDAGIPVDSRNSQQHTALLMALSRGYGDLSRLLLENGADSNARDSSDSTALMLAATHNLPDVVRQLCARGASVDARGKHGDTALIRAALEGLAPAVQALLDCGADPLVKNDYQKTALDYANGAGAAGVTALLGAR